VARRCGSGDRKSTQGFVTPDLFRGPPGGKRLIMRERQPCVYLLSSGHNGRLYCGVTSNLIGRIQQHRDEVFDGFTTRYDIKRLVWFEIAETMEAAIAREKTIKKWPRDWKRNLIERDNPAWNDLAVGFGLQPLG
jgi:putative endonuclease